MAVQSLRPAASLANTRRTHSKLTLARFIKAATAHDAVRCHSFIESKLAARHPVDSTTTKLGAPSPPDFAVLTTKLRFIVTNMGTPPQVPECLAMDVSRLAGRAARACAWRHRLSHRVARRAVLPRCAQRSPGHPSTLVEMLSTRVLAGVAARSSRKTNSMMIRATPSQTRQPEPSTRLAACFQKWEPGSFLIAMIGMFRFDTSTALLGKGRVVAELCVPIRAPYFNINGKHGASDAKLTDDAVASDSRGEPLPARRRKLHKAIQ